MVFSNRIFEKSNFEKSIDFDVDSDVYDPGKWNVRSRLKIYDIYWKYTIIGGTDTIIRENYTIICWKYTIFYVKLYDPLWSYISSEMIL